MKEQNETKAMISEEGKELLVSIGSTVVAGIIVYAAIVGICSLIGIDGIS
jgi:hypothetical protein